VRIDGIYDTRIDGIYDTRIDGIFDTRIDSGLPVLWAIIYKLI
jgi:hypothetical protein